MKNKHRKLLLSIILAIFASLLLAVPALAVPVCQAPRTVEQSCGTPLTIRFLGDEFIHWQETLTGEVIAYNPDTNNWYYAYVDGEYLYPGSEKVRPITPLFGSRADTITAEDMCGVFEAANYYRTQFESRLRPINLTSNRIPLLAILIEFENRQFSDFYLCSEFPTLTSFWSNQKFGSEGKTVNTYFAQSSHDFDLQFIKPDFTVADGFRVENPTAQVSLLEIRDGIVRVRVNAPHPNTAANSANALAPSVTNAFNALRDYLDLSNIPISPGTNLVQAGSIERQHFVVTTIIAGYEASATGLRPHINGHARFVGGAAINPSGNLTAYGAMGELSASGIMGIGGTIHEIGHLFGLPDLYSFTPFSPALGRFSVMCFGSHSSLVGQPPGTSPPLLDPWSKIQLGFIEPIVVNASEHRIVDMYGMDANSPYNVVQVISDADPDQHFLVENRRTVGFDAPLSRSNTFNHGNIPRGEGGILIYHIDDRVLRDERLLGQRRGVVNSNPFHRGVDLEAMMTPVPGDLNPANFNPFFVRGGLRYTFNPTTTPNSNFHTPGLCHDHRNGPFNCHPQTVLSNIHIRVNEAAGQVVEVEFGIPGSEPCCPIVAYGRFADQVGGEELRGAAWELCECGILTVGEGFIHWEGQQGSWWWQSPWAAHSGVISKIVFTGPIVAGESLSGLFADLGLCCCFSCCCFSSMFPSELTTIEGLEHFDTSNVTNMSGMFNSTRSLTSLDLSSFDTSNVTNMSGMFGNTSSLTSLDISNWDTGNVTDMSSMFVNASSLTALDISNWDTSSVTSMASMFGSAWALTTLDVSNWDTGNVTDMSWMFGFASSLTALDVSNWDTSNVVNMHRMFIHASTLTALDVSNWDTSNVTDMLGLFESTRSLTSLDVSNWDTSNAVSMWLMFSGASSLTSLDVSNFDTSNVTSMASMFNGTHSLTSLDVSNFDTSNVTNMNWMFGSARSLASLDLSGWDTSRVTNMTGMFNGATSLSSLSLGENFRFVQWTNLSNGRVFLADLPPITPTNYFTGFWQNVGTGTIERPQGTHVLTSAQLMAQFNGATMADTWVWQPVITGCPIVAQGRFADQVGGEGLRGAAWELCECGVLTIGEGFIHWAGWRSPWNNPDDYYADAINRIVIKGPITAGESLRGLFSGIGPCYRMATCSYFSGNLPGPSTIEGLEHFDTSNVKDMSRMFSEMYSLTNLDLSSFNTSNVTNMSSMFSSMYLLAELDLSNWDTSNVTDMSGMFSGTFALNSLDVSGFDTSNVTHMGAMFSGTFALNSLDVSGFDTSNVTSMSRMFSGAGLTSLDVSNWDTSNVTNMSGMFSIGGLTSLDVSNWDTSNVTNMSGMFSGTGLTSLDVSNWDTSNVTNMDSMFRSTWSTSLDISSFDTSNVTNMNNMFWGASSLKELDLSSWNTSRATRMSGMFSHASSLTDLDISSFDTSNVTNMNSMFSNTTSLSSLTLGRDFAFRGTPHLPAVVATSDFTGYWQNVGTGTPKRPQGLHTFTSTQLMEQFDGATMADTWVWQPVITECPIVSQGSFANQAGAGGITGAAWELCGCGTLTVNEGFINWTGATSPWHSYRTDIEKIEFSGTITTGMSLTNLFRDLSNVEEIKGLENFNTANLRHVNALFFNASSLTKIDLSSWNTTSLLNTANMFNGTSSLTELNLANWNTSNVTNMGSMFQGASALTTLDLSHFNTTNVTSMNAMFNAMTSLTTLNIEGFNTNNVTNMNNMFWNSSSLRVLTLGQDFEFRQTPNLPAVPNNGRWQNVGSGTVDNPQGIHILTSAELMSQFSGATMADTWVWQP